MKEFLGEKRLHRRELYRSVQATQSSVPITLQMTAQVDTMALFASDYIYAG